MKQVFLHLNEIFLVMFTVQSSRKKQKIKMDSLLGLDYQLPTIFPFVLVDPDGFLQEMEVFSAQSVCLIKR